MWVQYSWFDPAGGDAHPILDKHHFPTLHLSVFTTHFFNSPCKNLGILRKLFLDYKLSSSQIKEITNLAWAKTTIKVALSKYHIKREKRQPSTPKYGQKIVGGFRVPHQGEQVIIKKMLKLRKAGHTLQKIADTLNKQEFTNRSGGKWLACFVETIIKREQQQK